MDYNGARGRRICGFPTAVFFKLELGLASTLCCQRCLTAHLLSTLPACSPHCVLTMMRPEYTPTMTDLMVFSNDENVHTQALSHVEHVRPCLRVRRLRVSPS
jgi:hypothetical protein